MSMGSPPAGTRGLFGACILAAAFSTRVRSSGSVNFFAASRHSSKIGFVLAAMDFSFSSSNACVHLMRWLLPFFRLRHLRYGGCLIARRCFLRRLQY